MFVPASLSNREIKGTGLREHKGSVPIVRKQEGGASATTDGGALFLFATHIFVSMPPAIPETNNLCLFLGCFGINSYLCSVKLKC